VFDHSAITPFFGGHSRCIDSRQYCTLWENTFYDRTISTAADTGKEEQISSVRGIQCIHVCKPTMFPPKSARQRALWKGISLGFSSWNTVSSIHVYKPTVFPPKSARQRRCGKGFHRARGGEAQRAEAAARHSDMGQRRTDYFSSCNTVYPRLQTNCVPAKICTAFRYGVAIIRGLLKIISLLCRIYSLLYGSFPKETYSLRSQPIVVTPYVENNDSSCSESFILYLSTRRECHSSM